jgi:serine protease DegQ
MLRPAFDILAFVARFAVLGLAIAFVLVLLRPDWGDALRARLGAPPAAQQSVAVAPAQFVVSYADAVRRAAPSVVSIYTARVVTERPIQLVPNPTLQRFSGITLGQPRRRLERALGSGVLVSADGYVLTNHHVIANADEIQLVLWDGRTTRARLVGSDPDTDLAVLKIEGSNLPAMPLDNGAPVAVGDVVLAIGNPFGLGQTVTQGIVSGVSRNQLNLQTYEDFIQTDAAINEGNSGGALVTARGELIGINTFVLGRMVGAEGIGFAIPLGTARSVLQQIVEHGVVIRGWLGIEYGDAPILPGGLGPGTPRGVAITAVYPGGPADRVGLRPGDVLLTFDEQDISDQSDLRDREAALAPGTEVRLSGLRAGVPFDAQVPLAQRPRRNS